MNIGAVLAGQGKGETTLDPVVQQRTPILERFTGFTDNIERIGNTITNTKLPEANINVKANAGGSMITLVLVAVGAIVLAIFFKKMRKK